MGTEALKLKVMLPVEPDRVSEAWLDSGSHSAFTGSPAEIEPVVGGTHTAWDGYISGKILAIEPGRRIVKSWRTSEFPEGSPDSRLELHFNPVAGGTELVLLHSEIPEGQAGQYESGWEDFYFKPMRAFFGGAPERDDEPTEVVVLAPAPRRAAPARKAKPAVKKAAAKKAASPKKKPAAKAKRPAKKLAAKAKRPAKKLAAKGKAKKPAKKPAAKARARRPVAKKARR